MQSTIDHRHESSSILDDTDLTVRLETAERYLADIMQYLQDRLHSASLSPSALEQQAQTLEDAKQQGKTFLLPPEIVVYETDLRYLAENLSETAVGKRREQLTQKKAALQLKKASLIPGAPTYVGTLALLDAEAFDLAKAEQALSPEKITKDRQRIQSAMAQLETPQAKREGVSLMDIAVLLEDLSETLSYDIEVTPGNEPEATQTPKEAVFYPVSREITDVYGVVIRAIHTLQLIADLKWQAKQRRQQQLDRLRQLAQSGQLSTQDQRKKMQLEEALKGKRQREKSLEQRLGQLQQLKAEKPDQAAFIDQQISELEETLSELTEGDDQAYTAESLLPALIKALPEMAASDYPIVYYQLQLLEKIAYLLDMSRSAYQITSLCAAVQYKQKQQSHPHLDLAPEKSSSNRWSLDISRAKVIAFLGLLMLVIAGWMPKTMTMRVILEIGIGILVWFFLYQTVGYLRRHALPRQGVEKQNHSPPLPPASDEIDRTTQASLLMEPVYPEENLDANRLKADSVYILAALTPTLLKPDNHSSDETEEEPETVFYEENDVLPDRSVGNVLQNGEAAADPKDAEHSSELQEPADHSKPPEESSVPSPTMPFSVAVASCADVLFWQERGVDASPIQTQAGDSQQISFGNSRSIE